MKFSNFFDSTEFDSHDQAGTGVNMNPKFIAKLNIARTIADIPFTITSGYRTVKHNKSVGGLPNSAHLTGHAADISCHLSQHRFIIVKALLEAGFDRIVIYSNFIHVDNDPSKPARVIVLNFE